MDFKKIAVTNRNIQAGEQIKKEDLEKPETVHDLLMSGVVISNDEVINRQEAIGATVKMSVEMWQPLTYSMVNHSKLDEGENVNNEDKKKKSKSEVEKKEIRIEIAEIKGLRVDLPLEFLSLFKTSADNSQDTEVVKETALPESESIVVKDMESSPPKKGNHRKWMAKNQ